MIVLIKADDLIKGYKKISKIGRINYIVNATSNPKINDFGNVLSEFDARGMNNISATSFQISESCYDLGIPERTRSKKLDAFFASQEFAATIVQIVSEQLLHKNANYLITLTNKDYDSFCERYLETFAEIFDVKSMKNIIFLYDATRAMYKFVDEQLHEELDDIDYKLRIDDEDDDLLDARDDIIDKLNMLAEADNPDIGNKKAKKIVRKIFLDNCYISEENKDILLKAIKKYQKSMTTRMNYSSSDEDDD